MAKTVAHPFVKWAGGKTQLLPSISALIPKKFRTYYEPFVGGGAVFFALAGQNRFERAVLNDSNSKLMDCFQVIRDNPNELIALLKKQAEIYRRDPAEVYEVWKRLNPQCLSPVARAARLIAINKTCYNGLYRVNKAGEFNVPHGAYENPNICDATNIKACSELMSRIPTSLLTQDFTEALDGASEGDVVYFDPPYIPLSPTSNFASYTSSGFNLNDHYRLAAQFKILVDKGVTVVLSNSDTTLTRSLYEGYTFHEVLAKRHINSKGDRRGPVGELLIEGYRTGDVSVESRESPTNNSIVES